MAISTFAKGFAGALTAAAILVSQAGHAGTTTLMLVNPATQSNTPETVVFTATGEAFVIDQGYQVNDIEKLTNNAVTLSGGGANLLGSTWKVVLRRLAATHAHSVTALRCRRWGSPLKTRLIWTHSTRCCHRAG